MTKQTREEIQREQICRRVTDICLDNGGVTKPMADELTDYVDEQIRQAFAKGEAVGQYRAANKLYIDITTLYMFKNNLDNSKVGIESTIDRLLRTSEKILNDNSKTYTGYIREPR